MPNAYGNIMFNYTIDDEAKRQLYNDKRFRHALSVAINRDEIIKLIYKGGVFASQIAPLRGPPYHGEDELFQSWTQHDPDLANQMLDEIGITERDAEGFRLGPDGNELLMHHLRHHCLACRVARADGAGQGLLGRGRHQCDRNA